MSVKDDLEPTKHMDVQAKVIILMFLIMNFDNHFNDYEYTNVD